MKKQTLLSLASAAIFTFQCGSAMAADKTFGVLLKNVKDPYWAFVSEGAKAAAKEIGVDVDVLAAQSDADVGPQLDMCNTMIQRKMDAFIVAAVTPDRPVSLSYPGDQGRNSDHRHRRQYHPGPGGEGRS